LIVAVIVLLLFGRTKISDVIADFAHGIKAFKKGMLDDDRRKASQVDTVKVTDNPDKESLRSCEMGCQTENADT